MISQLLVCFCLIVPAQGSDTALRDRVARLVDKLDADKKEARDVAEKTLIELGAKALAFIPDAKKDDSKDRVERLERIRKAMRDAADKLNLDSSKITIKVEGIRLSEAIKTIQKQSGNIVTDLRDEPANPTFDLDFKDKPFLECLTRSPRRRVSGLNSTRATARSA